MPALEQFLGSSAGLSPATVTRYTAQWQADRTAFQDRDLSATDYVYLWADGVHLRVRLDQAKACGLVLIGVRADGTKELIALDDGYRESSEAWASLLLTAPAAACTPPSWRSATARWAWKALAEAFPATREQRCWVHKTANILDALPKSAQPAAKRAVQDIYNAEDRDHARAAVKAFAGQYGAKYPKVVKRLVDDEEELLAFFDFPAETGSICAPQIPSNRPSPPYGSGPRSPRVPAAEPPHWAWCSS
ncbi:transposase [Streptomyces sp. NPDC059352]|uniref:transposase n=1 Tax=Streptomyces sp. NPDC059352 TaxID=3346810 RepID=UPI00368BAE0D